MMIPCFFKTGCLCIPTNNLRVWILFSNKCFSKNACIELPWEGREDPWGYMRKGIMRRTGQAGKYAPVLRDMVAEHEGEEALSGPVH